MKIYKSKIDWWFVIVMFAALGTPIFYGIRSKESVPILIFSGILAIIIYWLLTMRYIIDNRFLSIYSTKIDINRIRRIQKSRSILSSPAFSFDRIEILYNRADVILLSPKEREDFIEELLKVNPNIEVKL